QERHEVGTRQRLPPGSSPASPTVTGVRGGGLRAFRAAVSTDGSVLASDRGLRRGTKNQHHGSPGGGSGPPQAASSTAQAASSPPRLQKGTTSWRAPPCSHCWSAGSCWQWPR